MENYLIQELLNALSTGDLKRFSAYTIIFFVLWLEMRGMKNQLKLLNKNIAVKFQEGEHRFEVIEKRLTKIEQVTQPIGGVS